MVKYKINFVKYGNPRSYYVIEKEFADENHFANYLKLCGKDESNRKIVGTEKVFSQAKEFTTNDLKEAYKVSKSESFSCFEDWFKNYFKRELK